ncbi:hypothetical protein [Salipiger bermudensis]|uniref:hypothetical protein n=1 Tax=Salipiger bermudensis TaxID=344736 RepID=UPI001CD19B18|nr:hypothetical protein [Salipiger bermudensis]MCA1286736.1 hypothetical protein [Salipiger bermudensis]
MTNDIAWRKLVKNTGARTDRYGPKLTMNIARASVVRCPDTGKPSGRDTDTFKRMEARFAPR